MAQGKRFSAMTAFGTACALAACLALSACGGSSSGSAGAAAYADGTYTGTSSVLDAGADGDGYAEVELTVEGGAIADAKVKAFKPDGTPKDESYGKDGNSYALAQKVISSIDDYADQLVSVGDPAEVDVISGATFLHDQIVEAAQDALSQAV